MSTTSSLPPFSFATHGLILRLLQNNSLEKCEKSCDVADNNPQQSENIVLYDQETHISTLISMKVEDRNYLHQERMAWTRNGSKLLLKTVLLSCNENKRPEIPYPALHYSEKG